MNQGNESKGLSDITLVIVAFVVVFLYFTSLFMYVDGNEIKNAQKNCQHHGGLDKYYLHFGAKKFECQDGTTFKIREGKKNPLFLWKIFAQ